MNNISKLITGIMVCLCICFLTYPAMAVVADDFGHIVTAIDNNLRDISSTGTQLGLGDDETAADIPIGFDFNFYGNVYSVISVRSNGYMGFVPGFSDTNHGWTVEILGTSTPNNSIYGCCIDLNPGSGGAIYYETLGTEPDREFVVGFYDVEEYDASANLFTFEMIIHEGTNRIELQYGNCPVGTETKTVGIDNVDGTDYLALARAESVDFSNQAYLFTRSVAGNPRPANDPDSAVEVTTDLEWDAPEYVPDGYNVYVGADPNMDDHVSLNQPGTIYDPPGDFEFGTLYYWRVDTIDPNDGGPVVITGNMWVFKTEPAVPKFIVQPKDQAITEFDDAVLTVEVTTGGGASTFMWYKVGTGEIVHDGSKYTIVSDDATSSLTIGGFVAADEGEYYCEATNPAGMTPSENALLELKKLIGYWTFDDTLADSAGSTDGTFSDGSPSYAEGIVNGAITLDGVDDHVVFGTSSDFNFGADKDFTVSLWIKSEGDTGDCAIMSNKDWDSGGNIGWVMTNSYGDGNWGLNFTGEDSSRVDVRTSSPINDNQWHHLCISFDRDGMATLYYDGTFDAEVSIDGQGNIDAGFPTVLGTDGAEGDPWAYWIPGDFDDVRIFNWSLSAEEVALEVYDVTGDYICVNPVANDINNDCVVDIQDLAIVANSWLDCGLYPASYCP